MFYFFSFSILDFSISLSFDLRFLPILFAMFSSFISAGKKSAGALPLVVFIPFSL